MSVADARTQLDTQHVYGASLSAEAILSLGCLEGVYDPVVQAPAPADQAAARRAALLPGWTVAAAVASFAYFVHLLPFAPFSVRGELGVRHPVSSAIVAIIAGLVLSNVLSLPATVKAGCKSIVKKVIPLAIVLMGAGLNLTHLAAVGFTALAITVVCIAVGVLGGIFIGRLCGLGWRTALLLGTGTGICGNSAIAAVAPLIDAQDDELALSIGTVNLFGLLAMLAWPMIGGMLHLSDEMFGVWCGTTIHAVPQVVAAGFAFTPQAGTLATLVKLVRVTMLAPLVFVLAILYAKQHTTEPSSRGKLSVRYARLVPWFVWGFVVFALLNTLGLLPTLQFQLADFFTSSDGSRQFRVELVPLMTGAGKALLTFAMAAIGLEVNLRALAGVGGRAIKAGFISTLVLGATSLALISLFM